MSLPTVAHETFVIERTYDVPVAQTFQAWADPLLKARWFAGSADALGSGYELDFRVGGRETNRGGTSWRAHLHVRNVCRRRPHFGIRRHGPVQRPRCDVAAGRHGTGSVPRWPRHCGSAGGGNPFPSGLASSQLEQFRIVRKSLLRLLLPVDGMLGQLSIPRLPFP
jgi:hypothetical protein